MGFFSWNTLDSGRSVSNRHSSRGALKVRLVWLDANDNLFQILEPNYDGYGEFGGIDYYELFAELNGLGKDRTLGIHLYYGDKEGLNYPHLVEWEHSTNDLLELMKYSKGKKPQDCSYQGYFYEDELDAMFNW